jgi:non-ribosomal peptide synthetase component E (peptide arylation enzyme)
MVGNLGQILPRAARKFGSKTALVGGDRAFTFTDLDELSARLGNAMVAVGSQPDEMKGEVARRVRMWF